MPKIAFALGIATGLAAVVIVYLTFLAHEFVKAGRTNVALGTGVIPYVATRPTFLVAAAIAFVLILYEVVR
jgi:hypothetical protein